MRRKTKSFPLILGPLFVVLVGFAQTFRSAELPRGQNTLFSGSGNCAACHSPGAEGRTALRNSKGEDVSPASFWRSTMMANAAKDPFWRAKVSAEIAANPGLKEAIEDKCVTCHAPMGRTDALSNGATTYSIAEMEQDPLALDGVSCTVCHQIQPGNLGTGASFSGGFQIEGGQTIFGPFEDPLGWPMLALSGYDPVFGSHVRESELCASCHTLFTTSVDEQGNPTGQLAEQTPYLEWLNSDYPGRNIECQTCHMPVEPGEITVSNTPTTLDARSSFSRHEFVGGNAFMLTMLRDNAEELGVTAESAQFDSTIARTRRMLGTASAELSADVRWDGDTLEVSVRVQNIAGHKIPTGYPSRRMWVDLAVRRGGEVVFRSGAWDGATGEVVGIDDGFEPHHTSIRSEDQVQVYQAVMGDSGGAPVYGLLRATNYLKDNRLPPSGWVPTGPWSEETQIRGLARDDADFNSEDGTPGTGSDEVKYRLPLPDGIIYQVDIRLRYQTIAPRFAEALLKFDTEEVNQFRGMYEAMSMDPELMDSITVVVGFPSDLARDADLPHGLQLMSAFPNPADRRVQIRQERPLAIAIYDMTGRSIRLLAAGESEWDLKDQAGRPVPPGVYFLVSAIQSGAVPITVVR